MLIFTLLVNAWKVETSKNKTKTKIRGRKSSNFQNAVKCCMTIHTLSNSSFHFIFALHFNFFPFNLLDFTRFLLTFEEIILKLSVPTNFYPILTLVSQVIFVSLWVLFSRKEKTSERFLLLLRSLRLTDYFFRGRKQTTILDKIFSTK